jgi:uncharacterized protein YbjT (DUF2867 family)
VALARRAHSVVAASRQGSTAASSSQNGVSAVALDADAERGCRVDDPC